MPKHTYAVTIGPDTYDVGSDSELTDAQAYEFANAQHEQSMTPAQRLERLQTANAKSLPAQPSMGDEFTPTKMGERALAGLKGEAKGFVGGVAAPVLALGYAMRHPVDAAEKAGQAALGLGAMGYQAVTHPSETYDAAKGAVLRLGANPEAIGEVAGGIGAGLAIPPITKAALGTRAGQAVAAGVSEAANRIPGVEAARKVYAVVPAVVPAKAGLPPRLVKTGAGPGGTGSAQSFSNILASELTTEPADVAMLRTGAPGPTMTPQGRPSWPPPGGEPPVQAAAVAPAAAGYHAQDILNTPGSPEAMARLRQGLKTYTTSREIPPIKPMPMGKAAQDVAAGKFPINRVPETSDLRAQELLAKFGGGTEAERRVMGGVSPTGVERRAMAVEGISPAAAKIFVKAKAAPRAPDGTILQPIKSQLETALAHELAKRSK